MKINFSANLETIRKSKKISQEELAEDLACASSSFHILASLSFIRLT